VHKLLGVTDIGKRFGREVAGQVSNLGI